MNDDFENLQKLIALKRFEQPPEGFVEDFMREFHFLQRQAASRPTQLQLFWEKLSGYFDSLSGPAWGAVGAAAALVVASISSLNESSTSSLPSSHGMKPVDFKETREEAAFKATPIIFGVDASEDEKTSSPVKKEAPPKTEQPGTPAVPAPPAKQ